MIGNAAKCLLVSLMAIVGFTSQSLAADAASGGQLAQKWCANCHLVGAAQTGSLQQGPPSFRTVAGHLNTDQLRTFLTHPHGAMPDLALTRSEIDDLIAYIESLR